MPIHTHRLPHSFLVSPPPQTKPETRPLGLILGPPDPSQLNSGRQISSTSSAVMIRFEDSIGIQIRRYSRDTVEIRCVSITVGKGLHVVLVMQAAYLPFPPPLPHPGPASDWWPRRRVTQPLGVYSGPLDFHPQRVDSLDWASQLQEHGRLPEETGSQLETCPAFQEVSP